MKAQNEPKKPKRTDNPQTIHMLLLRKGDNAGGRMPGAAHVAGWKDTSLPPGLLHPLGSGRKETTWET